MNSFSDFNIKIDYMGFEGNKIKISKVLNKEIIIDSYKIEDSKVFKSKGNGKCLYLQITLNNTKHVIFTSSLGLIEAISLVPKKGFPFKTIILENNNRYIFS